MNILEYLVARNEGGKVFSSLTDTELLLRTERGIYLTSVNTKKAPISFLHIANRLGDASTPLDEIGRQLMLIPARYGEKRTGVYNIEPLQTKLGCKAGRVWRPVYGWGTSVAFRDAPLTERVYVDRLRQSTHLYEKLLKFGSSVDLTQSNIGVYGSETRDLLLIACVEVEALFKMLIFENFQNERGRMEVYWKCSRPAKLPEYELRFPEIPGLPSLRPFSDWGGLGASSYAPLRWYQAYNEIKHGAIAGSAPATLERAMDAIAACFILLSAIGTFPLTHATPTQRVNDAFKEAFILDSRPSWSPGESYWSLPGKPLRFTAIS
jgi:hypothetical protein